MSFQQVTVSAHHKQTSMLHRFLLHPRLQELHRWALHQPPHRLRIWAKLPPGSLTSLIASMVRRALCIKIAASFLSQLIFLHLSVLPISLVILLGAATAFLGSWVFPLDEQELADGTI